MTLDQCHATRQEPMISGAARLTLRDPSGTELYTRSLTETGTFTSASGASGNWRIEVRLENVAGTLNFRVQKR